MSSKSILCNNHIIRWKNKINCSKIELTADKINETTIATITNNKFIISNNVFTSIDHSQIKGPYFIKNKIKAAFKDSKGTLLILYENCTLYYCGKEQKIGSLL